AATGGGTLDGDRLREARGANPRNVASPRDRGGRRPSLGPAGLARGGTRLPHESRRLETTHGNPPGPRCADGPGPSPLFPWTRGLPSPHVPHQPRGRGPRGRLSAPLAGPVLAVSESCRIRFRRGPRGGLRTDGAERARGRPARLHHAGGESCP